MIGKILMVMVLIFLVMLSVAIIYQNMPVDPVSLKTDYIQTTNLTPIDYGDVPVFAENLRFNHNVISYYISNECSLSREYSIKEAFSLFAGEIKVVSFNEVYSENEADIEVECSDDFVELDENLFAAGEGGPSKIINTSVFKTIEKGNILLYYDKKCSYPIVEMHELLHVFGFAHSEDPLNIMYSVSDCRQRMSQDMIDLMIKLYSIEPLPDISITNLSAIKKGAYLDFNITVLNEGLVGIDNIQLTVTSGSRQISVLDLGEIGIGYGRTLRVGNLKLPSRGIDRIEFVVDAQNLVRELDKKNNIVIMIVED